MSTGHIRSRGPNAWELKYDIGRDPATGERRTRTATVRGGKRDAERRLRELLSEVDRGVAPDAGKMTVGVWLTAWLDECRHTVAPKTLEERQRYVRHHLVPGLGTIPLAKLGPAHIQAFYSAALTNGRRDGKGGLSPQTVRHLDRVLHTALERARKLHLIALNPTADVDRPRVERAAIITLRLEQQATLLAAASGTHLYLPVLLALATGLRRGEALGLTWKNVDLDAGLLRVVQVIEQTKAGVRIKPQPKSAHSRRAVTLPAVVVEALREHRVNQAEEHLRLGLGPLNLLFPRAAANPAVFSVDFGRLATRAGIKTRFHDLRHTHISDLLASGVHPKLVSERAGHSSVAFTLQIYAHVTPTMHEAAAQQLDAALRRVIGAVPL
jgi:integrase